MAFDLTSAGGGGRIALLFGFLGQLLWRKKIRQETTSEELKRFRQVEREMPNLIAEMRTDLGGEEDAVRREFITGDLRGMHWDKNSPVFCYSPKKHRPIVAKMDRLIECGYVYVVEKKQYTTIYRFDSEFVGLVLGRK